VLQVKKGDKEGVIKNGVILSDSEESPRLFVILTLSEAKGKNLLPYFLIEFLCSGQRFGALSLSE